MNFKQELGLEFQFQFKFKLELELAFRKMGATAGLPGGAARWSWRFGPWVPLPAWPAVMGADPECLAAIGLGSAFACRFLGDGCYRFAIPRTNSSGAMDWRPWLNPVVASRLERNFVHLACAYSSGTKCRNKHCRGAKPPVILASHFHEA